MDWLPWDKLKRALQAANVLRVPLDIIDDRDDVEAMPKIEHKLEVWHARLTQLYGADKACVKVQDAFLPYITGEDEQARCAERLDLRVNTVEDPDSRLSRLLAAILNLPGGIKFLDEMDTRLGRWEEAENG